MASSDLGIGSEEFDSVVNNLPLKLANNKNLVKALLNDMSKMERESIIKLCPELGNV